MPKGQKIMVVPILMTNYSISSTKRAGIPILYIMIDAVNLTVVYVFKISSFW